MKRMLCAALACLLFLPGCGGRTAPAAFDPRETVRAVLDSGAFSEQLEELDSEMAGILFSLTGDAAQYESAVLYYSTGATSEIAAVVDAGSADRAGAVESALSQWVDLQIEITRNYQPAEVEKLEHAILETREDTVLLVVAADWEAAQAALP